MPRLPLSLVALCLMAAPALAQTASAPPPLLSEPPAGAMRASAFKGVPVIGMDHVRIGTIEDLLLGPDGRVAAVVVGTGGVLGLGEKKVAVPFDRFAWNAGEGASGPRSYTTPDSAPSEARADSAGPGTMPGAQASNEVLAAVEGRRSGEVSDTTGSVTAQQPRGRATVPLVGPSGGPKEAEVRMTKAEFEAAPAFRYEAETK
jgi:hypothetical protein